MKTKQESGQPKRPGMRSKGTLYFIVLGVVSIVWLLLRVIPKPSRIKQYDYQSLFHYYIIY